MVSLVPFTIGPWISWNEKLFWINYLHYDDVIMGAIGSQITSLTIVYSTVYSDTDQRKHQSSASLAFVRGIHRSGEFPAQMASDAENVSIWSRHHDTLKLFCKKQQTVLSHYGLSLGPEQTSAEFQLKYNNFRSRKCISNVMCILFGPQCVKFHYGPQCAKIHYFLVYILCFLYISYSGSANAQLPGCFCPWIFSLNIGLNMFPLDSFMSCLHSLTRILYRGVPGFATDCPCGVWCRGLTICPLYVGPLFGNLV